MPLQTRPVTQRRSRGARYNGPDHTWASEQDEAVLRGDVTAGLHLVLNEAKVVPARFVFVKPATAAKGDERRVASLPSPQHHEMVKVILRSLVFRNPTQVQLIRGDPRYMLMSPEDVIGKYVSFELMIKGSKHIVGLEQGGTSTPEVQPVAFKATEGKKEEFTSSRLPIDASKLDNEEMALIIRSFRQILKQRRGKDYKPRSKRVCYKCGKPGHFIAKCPMSSDSDRDNDKRGKKKGKTRYYKKKGSDAHVCWEWDSDESSIDSSSDEDAANIAVNKGLLFPNIGHKCFMTKDDKKKKVQSRTTPSILHLVTRVVLVMMKMIDLHFLPTLTCHKRKN
jgi:hypothetical protein